MAEPRTTWIDRLVRAIDRGPLPAWFVYTLIYLVCGALIHLGLWLDEIIPWGEVSALWGVIAGWSIVSLAGLHYLIHAADDALDRFAPLATEHGDMFERYRADLTTIPGWAANGGYGAFFFLAALAVIAEPAFAYEGLEHPVSRVGAILVLGWSYSFGPALIGYGLRAIRTVARLYTLVDRVDLQRQGALYAPSGFAMRCGLVLLALVMLSVASNIVSGTSVSEEVVTGALLAVMIPLALAALFVPVRGIHRRLAREKQQLLEENATAVDRARRDLYHALGDRNHAEVESIDRGLTSLFRLRDELEDTATWPWSRSSFRNYVSAVLLPLIVWIAQQLLAGLV